MEAFCYSISMINDNKRLSIDTVYLSLVEIIKNDARKPLDQVGSYVVGSTMAKEGIDGLFEKYPILEEIAEIGASMEWQGKDYLEEYYQQLKTLIEVLGKRIDTK